MSIFVELLPSERLRVGQCTVDIALREVRAPGMHRPRRITPKSMGVLLVLVAEAGRVVSRDTLLARVWPDTLPSDDVVTQAVTQLRKAFGEVRGDPQYIETIAKGGYRLVAPVEWLGGVETPGITDPAGPAADLDEIHLQAVIASAPTNTPVGLVEDGPVGRDPRAPTLRGSWSTIAVALLVAATLVVGLLWWSLPRDGVAPASGSATPAEAADILAHYQLQTRLITSAPGFELSPTLSPDGAMVAYVAVPEGSRNIAIMVQTTTPTAPRQLTRPSGMADDASPQWSPDGREIAFLRLVPGQDCQALVVPANGGSERTVARCDPDSPPGFAWTPDGRGLIFDGLSPDSHQAGLHIFDLASGAVSAIDYPRDPDNLDLAPRYSPDGRWIVFMRNSPLGDFWRIPATGGAAEQLTTINADIRGWDWSPDGRALIYARRSDSISRLYRYNLDTGIHIDLGVEDGEYPATANDTQALAYVVRRTYFGIYRFNPDDDLPGRRLFASSGRDRLPAIAPDGRQLVFTSDRAGPFGLWWADVERPESLRLLEGIRPESRDLPAWSADSKRVLVIGSVDGNAGSGLYEVVPASGRVTHLALPVRNPVQAAYLSGSSGAVDRLLVLADGGGGRLQLRLFGPAPEQGRSAWEPLATLDDVARIQVDEAYKRVLFARVGELGLWQVDFQLDPSTVQPVGLEAPMTSVRRAWTAAPDGGIYATRRTAECSALLFHQAGTGSAMKRNVGEPRCLDRNRRIATTGFSFNPRTNSVYVALAEFDGGDIGFATFDQPAESMWPGVIK